MVAEGGGRGEPGDPLKGTEFLSEVMNMFWIDCDNGRITKYIKSQGTAFAMSALYAMCITSQQSCHQKDSVSIRDKR